MENVKLLAPYIVEGKLTMLPVSNLYNDTVRKVVVSENGEGYDVVPIFDDRQFESPKEIIELVNSINFEISRINMLTNIVRNTNEPNDVDNFYLVNISNVVGQMVSYETSMSNKLNNYYNQQLQLISNALNQQQEKEESNVQSIESKFDPTTVAETADLA